MAIDDILLTFVRLILAAVFTMAGLLKVRDVPGFTQTVVRFGILPRPAASAFAWLVPWLEIATGILLFAGVMIVAASLLALVLMLSFLFASLWAVYRRLSIECSCFGLLYQERIGSATIVRDTILVAFAATALLLDPGTYGILNLITRTPDATDSIILFLTLGAAVSSTLIAYKTIRQGRRSESHLHMHEPIVLGQDLR